MRFLSTPKAHQFLDVLEETFAKGTPAEQRICKGVVIKSLKLSGVKLSRARALAGSIPCGWRTWKTGTTSVKRCRTRRHKITDAEVKAGVEPYTSPSCKWSRTTQQPLRTLKASKKSLHKTRPSLRRLCSFRTLCRKLLRGRLGVGVGSPRVDDCDYCVKHDRKVQPEIKRLLKEWHEQGKALHPAYWLQWESSVKSTAAFQEPDFEPADSPSYLTKLSTYCNDWAKPRQHYGILATLSDEKQKDILDFGARVYLALTGQPGWADMVASISAHWHLRDNPGAEFEMVLTNPKENCLYLHWDLADWVSVSAAMPVFTDSFRWVVAFLWNATVLCTTEEIDTFPRGPIQVGEDWYAMMRLAFSTVGVHVWSRDLDNFYTYLSRCMEKQHCTP